MAPLEQPPTTSTSARHTSIDTNVEPLRMCRELFAALVIEKYTSEWKRTIRVEKWFRTGKPSEII